ncbi:hypothetical protein C0995_016643 [Termitomyces sp. Mi166|nr:hypothetical protein C0995_016643 [Termitomyces sp. Mi166\
MFKKLATVIFVTALTTCVPANGVAVPYGPVLELVHQINTQGGLGLGVYCLANNLYHLGTQTDQRQVQAHANYMAALEWYAAANSNSLSLILLEYAPKFILIVPLKGAFLYVTLAVSHILCCSLPDPIHAEDIVALERQLSESSMLVNVSVHSSLSSPTEMKHHKQRTKMIDLLFCAHTKRGSSTLSDAKPGQ